MQSFLNRVFSQVGTPTGSRVLFPAAAIAVALLAVAQSSIVPAPQSATAQSRGVPTTTTPFNSTEDRKQMIEQMRLINERLARIETKLSQPLDVRVKEMPAAPAPVVTPPPGVK